MRTDESGWLWMGLVLEKIRNDTDLELKDGATESNSKDCLASQILEVELEFIYELLTKISY